MEDSCDFGVDSFLNDYLKVPGDRVSNGRGRRSPTVISCTSEADSCMNSLFEFQMNDIDLDKQPYGKHISARIVF